MFQHVQVIVNPASGQGQPLLHTLNQVFHPAGIDWDVQITKEHGDARRMATSAAAAGADLVVACGGDGTVMEVASGLIGSDVPLAILPTGTANVMSVELGIPAPLHQACQLLTTPDHILRGVDMGQVEDRYFMLRASTGFEAERVKGADRDLKDRFGSLAYLISALQQDIHATYTYHLTLDGQRVDTQALTCIVANSGNMGRSGLTLLPNIDVSDGLLDVIVIRNGNIPSLVSAAYHIISNTENTDNIQRWQVREVSIETDTPHIVQADGEIWGDTPVHVRVLPRAVHIVIPHQNNAAQQEPAN
jgi:YegS/Rv2252/BmrU family lipid kinase